MCHVFNKIVASRVNRKKPKIGKHINLNFYVRAITNISYDIASTRLVYSNMKSFGIIKIIKILVTFTLYETRIMKQIYISFIMELNYLTYRYIT